MPLSKPDPFLSYGHPPPWRGKRLAQYANREKESTSRWGKRGIKVSN